MLEENNVAVDKTKEDRGYCVYIHTNKINGKKYVGQTCQKIEYRWRNGDGYKANPHFYNAIRKYGWDNFAHEIIKSGLTKEEANNLEKFLIKNLNTINQDTGYNMRDGGSSYSEETNKKISKSLTGRKLSNEHISKLKRRRISEETRNKISKTLSGRHLPDEHKKNISKALTGRIHSEETRKKLSKSHKGKIISDETKQKLSEINTGKKLSEQTKKKMSEVSKGHRVSEETRNKIGNANRGANSPNSKKAVQYTKDGEFIKIWDCAMDVQRELGIRHSHVSECCKGQRKSAGGFIWKYPEDENYFFFE